MTHWQRPCETSSWIPALCNAFAHAPTQGCLYLTLRKLPFDLDVWTPASLPRLQRDAPCPSGGHAIRKTPHPTIFMPRGVTRGRETGWTWRSQASSSTVCRPSRDAAAVKGSLVRNLRQNVLLLRMDTVGAVLSLLSPQAAPGKHAHPFAPEDPSPCHPTPHTVTQVGKKGMGPPQVGGGVAFDTSSRISPSIRCSVLGFRRQ